MALFRCVNPPMSAQVSVGGIPTELEFNTNEPIQVPEEVAFMFDGDEDFERVAE